MINFTIITGPMFSSKSKRLLEVVDKSEQAYQKVLKLYPATDDRNGAGVISARSTGKECKFDTIPAYAVSSKNEVIELMKKEHYDIILIDEAQFAESWLIEVIEGLLYGQNGFQNVAYSKDLKIYVVGLDMDYKREPFHHMGHLMCLADEVTKMKAICCQCRDPNVDAIFTQRISGGEERVQVGNEAYQARCRNCHYIYMPEQENPE